MCDTFVAMPGATADGSVVLAKNSDRDPNEAHEVVILAAAEHPPGARLATTYIDIPQVRRTHAVLLAKPFWIWGAEMGVNEHGVVIGNEAVFTRVRHEDQPGLIGMDLLRLGLERAATAEEAVDVITALLAEHGQGGNCGFSHPIRYHNSFLVADAQAAWVLETAGREWAASRVSRFASISNAITQHRDPDRTSPGLVAEAVRRGWCTGPETFDFAAAYSDRVYTRFSDARRRQCRTEAALAAATGQVTPRMAMGVLRDHGEAGEAPGWTPSRGLLGQDVCAHAGYGPVRISQSVGSMVAQVSPDAVPTVWVTATSAPCTSAFTPVWIDGGLPDLGPAPTGTYDASTVWWRHEDLHRETLVDYPRRLAAYRSRRDALEADALAMAAKAVTGTAADRAETTAACFAVLEESEREWLALVRAMPRPAARGLHARAWRTFDRAAARP
jgi:secernin